MVCSVLSQYWAVYTFHFYILCTYIQCSVHYTVKCTLIIDLCSNVFHVQCITLLSMLCTALYIGALYTVHTTTMYNVQWITLHCTQHNHVQCTVDHFTLYAIQPCTVQLCTDSLPSRLSPKTTPPLKSGAV